MLREIESAFAMCFALFCISRNRMLFQFPVSDSKLASAKIMRDGNQGSGRAVLMLHRGMDSQGPSGMLHQNVQSAC